MKKIYSLFLFFFLFHTSQFAQNTNLGFEDGTTNGWWIGRDWDYNQRTPSVGMSMTIPSAGNVVTNTSTIGTQCTNGIDNYGGFPVVAPDGGSYSLLLNDNHGGSKVMVAGTNTFALIPNNSSLTFRFAAVLQDGGHTDSTKPYFFIWIRGYSNSGSLWSEFYDTNIHLPAMQTSSVDSTVHYVPWTTVTIDLSPYVGDNYTCNATVYVNDCNDSLHFGYAYIDAAANLYNITANPICTTGNSTTLYGPPGMASYNWSGPVTGTSQNTTTSTPGQYTLITTSFFDFPQSSNLVYNLIVDSIIPGFDAYNFCINDSSYFADQTIGSPNYWEWNFGDGSISNLQNPKHKFANIGSYTVSLIAGNACGAIDTIYKVITVNPLPTPILTPQSACAGANVNLCPCSNTYPYYLWKGPSGFTTGGQCINSSNVYMSGPNNFTITVKDTLGCVSTSTVNIMINPKPFVMVLCNNSVMCNGYHDTLNAFGASTYVWQTGAVGPHLIISTPGIYTATGTDTNGCVNTGSIYMSDEMCDSIWPGDANNDLIVDNLDILAIGIGNTTLGPWRYNATTNWVGQPCTDWPDTLSTGVNYKHIDCNGDGGINIYDTIVVIQNFGLTHLASKILSHSQSSGIPITLVPQQSTVIAGNITFFDILLGDNSTPANNIYGLAFTLQFDNTLIDANGIHVSGNGSWMGTTGNNLMTVDLRSPSETQFAITKTDHNNVSGNGKIGEISFAALSNITNNPMATFSITDATLIKYDQTDIPVDISAATASVTITNNTTGIYSSNNDAAKIYPNPANETLSIAIQQVQEYNGEVTVTNVMGEKVQRSELKDQKSQLDISKLEEGIYFVSVKTVQGISIQKIIVQH